MKNIIEARNLTFSYPADEGQPAHQVLKGVSFDIEEGSYVAILGHNGSGKSTLAKLLCMINSPDSGSLSVMGRDMTSPDLTYEEIMEARRDVGMVFQNP
ncbi:MAG: ATP-binding cassette domain-containing protein, partial [Clostridia bacterium]|nr:ATP-binding cassette domain-containing protein [Clostridia bacterium]